LVAGKGGVEVMSELIENYDYKLVTEHLIQEISRSENIYGPVFTRLAIENAVKFEAEKLGEDPPSIETLDELKAYLLSNVDRYPFCYCSAVYGLVKAESILQGAPGSDTRRTAASFTEKLAGSGESRVDLLSAVKSFGEMTAKMNVLIPFNIEEVGDDGSVTVSINKCPFKDACLKFEEEHITKMIGGKPCIMLRVMISATTLITGSECEYELEEFNNPGCKGKVYML